jgi:hypothetical protein
MDPSTQTILESRAGRAYRWLGTRERIAQKGNWTNGQATPDCEYQRFLPLAQIQLLVRSTMT